MNILHIGWQAKNWLMKCYVGCECDAIMKNFLVFIAARHVFLKKKYFIISLNVVFKVYHMNISCLKYHFGQFLSRLKHLMIKSEISVSDLSNL